MRRRELLVGLGASWFGGVAYAADTRLPPGVVIGFPPPLPAQPRLQAELARRFAGPYRPDNISGGFATTGKLAAEPLDLAALRAANGPTLDGGKFVYGLMARSESVLFEPLVAERSPILPDALRAVQLVATPPWVLACTPGLGVASLQDLAARVPQRSASDAPLRISVPVGIAGYAVNRLAKLMGGRLLRDWEYGGSSDPDRVIRRPGVDLVLLPLSPRLVRRAEEGRVRLLCALTTSAEAVAASAASMGLATPALPVLPPNLAGAAVPAYAGLFVAANLDEGIVSALHAACTAAFAAPGGDDLPWYYSLPPEGRTLGGVAALERRIRRQYRDFAAA